MGINFNIYNRVAIKSVGFLNLINLYQTRNVHGEYTNSRSVKKNRKCKRVFFSDEVVLAKRIRHERLLYGVGICFYKLCTIQIVGSSTVN